MSAFSPSRRFGASSAHVSNPWLTAVSVGGACFQCCEDGRGRFLIGQTAFESHVQKWQRRRQRVATTISQQPTDQMSLAVECRVAGANGCDCDCGKAPIDSSIEGCISRRIGVVKAERDTRRGRHFRNQPLWKWRDRHRIDPRITNRSTNCFENAGRDGNAAPTDQLAPGKSRSPHVARHHGEGACVKQVPSATGRGGRKGNWKLATSAVERSQSGLAVFGIDVDDDEIRLRAHDGEIAGMVTIEPIQDRDHVVGRRLGPALLDRPFGPRRERRQEPSAIDIRLDQAAHETLSRSGSQSNTLADWLKLLR